MHLTHQGSGKSLLLIHGLDSVGSSMGRGSCWPGAVCWAVWDDPAQATRLIPGSARGEAAASVAAELSAAPS